MDPSKTPFPSVSPGQERLPEVPGKRRTGKKPVNPDFDRQTRFPAKLWKAVNDAASTLLSWRQDGTGFVVDEHRSTISKNVNDKWFTFFDNLEGKLYALHKLSSNKSEGSLDSSDPGKNIQ